MIRVAVVDDQDLVRTGFRMILEEAPGIEVVGEASDGAQAVSLAGGWLADVILMDVRMPHLDGVEATRRLLGRDPAARVLILTTFDLDEYAFSALRSGASGFLLKDVPIDELVRAIRAVASGDAVVSPRLTRLLLDTYASQLRVAATDDAVVGPSPGALLTNRENEVVLDVVAGLSNQEIAAKLVLSETTVKSHVANILAKLGLRNRVHLVIYAYETGLVTPGSVG